MIFEIFLIFLFMLFYIFIEIKNGVNEFIIENKNKKTNEYVNKRIKI
jgi:hypothetical protein